MITTLVTQIEDLFQKEMLNFPLKKNITKIGQVVVSL